MILKKIFTVIILTLGLILLLNSFINKIDDDTVFGNWKNIKINGDPKIHTELFIDKETINVFSEEVNDIIFSNYYEMSNEKLIILENNKKDTIFTLKYEASENILKISSDKWNSEYIKIRHGSTLEDYILGVVTRANYINDFNSRKLLVIEE
ncbi:MAG: hypothetical protein COA50_11615 [Flavobacteriaceae bacterium]|nr:MAG: hypothetical protein COA50_11615 [Flavobacteriaceae bacterium]